MRKNILLLSLIILVISACAIHLNETERVTGVYHCVKSGETLWKISGAYNIDIQDLAEINNITNPGLIKVDSVIFIPGAVQVVDINIPVGSSETPVRRKLIVPKKSPETPVESKLSSPKKAPVKRDVRKKTEYKAKRKTKQHVKVRFERKRFIWPIKGRVISRFGIQPNGMKYNGINITAKEGTPVVAAAGGTVIHSAPLRYYGDTIIIKHRDRYATVYACLKDKKVKAGDRINKGQRIALLGKSGNNRKPYLHFEIRSRNKARNPLFFLPKRK